MKGGYYICDLQMNELASGDGAVTIPGIYAGLEGNYKKSVLLEGFVLDGVEQNAAFVVAIHAEDAYNMEIPGVGTISITSQDAVTFTAVENENEEE